MQSVEPDVRLKGTTAPAIRLAGVTRRFGTTDVLRDIDCSVEEKSRVAIIGPSGAGKTTLLRVLMTLDRPDAGVVEIFGEALWAIGANGRVLSSNQRQLRRVRGQIGMVFQHFNLFPHMTALRNVMEAPIHVLGLSAAEARERALDLLVQVGLEPKASAFPAQLSGGQQQRVAIARALAMRPKIMLFDEVTSALDPELVGEVLDVIRRLAHQGSMTMMIVTHEMSFAQDIADRVLFMDQGRIVEDSDPDAMFKHPTNERTRLFLRAVLQR